MTEPLWTTNVAHTLMQCAWRFTEKYKLGNICDLIGHFDHPDNIPPHSMAVKYEGRLSWYLIIWDRESLSYQVRWFTPR